MKPWTYTQSSTLDVGTRHGPLFTPPFSCPGSHIPLRFRLWQFNRLGPDTPSYWKAVYDLHIISSKCCHHLSLFTQLSDPVTFTDKHCPGKHSNTNPPAKIMTHLYIILHSICFLFGQFSLQLCSGSNHCPSVMSWKVWIIKDCTITAVGALLLWFSLLFHCERLK